MTSLRKAPSRSHGASLALTLALALALAACGSDEPRDTVVAPPPPPPPPTGFAFTYTPPAGVTPTSVFLAGSFNGWNATATRMTRQADGSWLGRYELGDGMYEYKFVINGAWPRDMCGDPTWGDPAHDQWIDPDALGCVPDGNGGQNAVIGVGTMAEGPGVSFTHSAGDPAYVSIAGGRLSIRFRAFRDAVTRATVRTATDTVPMHVQARHGMQDVWRATLPVGSSSYTIVVDSVGGSRAFGPFTAPAAPFRAVEWVSGAVGYQIFPERFFNGDATNDARAVETDEYQYLHPTQRGAAPIYTAQWNGAITSQNCCHQYYGGDLAGITAKLDHLQALGVSLLYLNPIWSSGSAHGYDTWDYMQVEPSFGDEAVLRTMLDAAHARGMKVIWDFVPNHVGVGHAAFRDAIARGPASPYWNWFTFKVPYDQVQAGNGNHYNGWWGFGGLPELRTTTPSAQAHLMDVVRKWTAFGFDGIRVDVPQEIDNRFEFFREFRNVAKGIDADHYLVGEIWERSPSWLQGDQFDALMNYAIGQEVVEKFTKRELTANAASAAMAQLYVEYPEAASAMLFNVIATHDTPRLLTKLGGGRLGQAPPAEALARQRLASAMLYALPGVPVTWQGDECAFLGAMGDGMHDEHRYPVQWDRCDGAMLAHYQRLGQLREGNAALESPAIRQYRAQGQLLAWLRGEPGAGEVLAVFNAGASSATLSLPEGSWTDLASGATVSGTATVDAVGWRYLRRS